MTAHFQTRGVLGLLGCWAILAQARLAARHLHNDLRYYVNHGAPSPRKQRQLSRGGATLIRTRRLREWCNHLLRGGVYSQHTGSRGERNE